MVRTTGAKLQAVDRIILPLFSAETVTILEGWNQIPPGCVCIAISQLVADEARCLNPSETIVSPRPDLPSMTQAVAGLIA